METDLSFDCSNCQTQAMCELWVDRYRELESRADDIGKLVAEGTVKCEGPRHPDFLPNDYEGCGMEVVPPLVADFDLASEISKVWPKSIKRSSTGS